jgi:LmbE family N-acetylglucosaminyl deacetylase
MRIMYIFPHPDDESFGPAAANHQQIQEGNEVVLLTFTKGGATKIRHQLGLSVQEMGQVREKEMERVKSVLGIMNMIVLDYEDGGLSRVHPIDLENEVKKWVSHLRPDIVVTYPVHGGSGHHDHIALHHAVKRVFFSKLPQLAFWKRLAFFTVIDTGKPMFLDGGVPRVTQSRKEDIAVSMRLSPENIAAMKNALLCYETYQEMVKTTNVVERIGNTTYFELAGESFDTVLSSLTESVAIQQ